MFISIIERTVTKSCTSFIMCNIYGLQVGQNGQLDRISFSKFLYNIPSYERYTHIYTLNIHDKQHKAIIREIQIDPITDNIIHVSFYVPHTFIRNSIPIYLNIPKGAKIKQHIFTINCTQPIDKYIHALTLEAQHTLYTVSHLVNLYSTIKVSPKHKDLLIYKQAIR